MKSITAHVRNGQIVPDEPMFLKDGTAVEVVIREQAETDELTDAEAEELELLQGR